MGEITFSNLFLYTIIPFGQLWARIFHYNGSLDMWWFLIPIFMMPPLQFVPMLFMYMGWMKKGGSDKKSGDIKSGGKIYDDYVWIPIFTKIIVQFIGPMIIPSYLFFMKDILVLISIIITKYLHSIDSCKSVEKELVISATKIKSELYNAVYENGVAGIFNVIIGLIPIIGWALFALSLNDTFNNFMVCICWALGYMFIYTIQNMFEQSDIDNFCNPSETYNSTFIKFIFGIILTLIAMINESIDPIGWAKTGLKVFDYLEDDE